jgi:hypothetical protein
MRREPKFYSFDATQLVSTPLATFQAFRDIDEATFGEHSRANALAVANLESIARRLKAASQRIKREATLDSATAAAGMLLCNSAQMAIAGARGVNVIDCGRVERELAQCDVGTYAVVIDCNTSDYPLLFWTVERVDAPANGSKATVLFDRASTDVYELPLHKGDTVKIVSATRDLGWWKALSSTGRVGLVPCNFLAFKSAQRKSLLMRARRSSMSRTHGALVMHATLIADADGVAVEGGSTGKHATLEQLIEAHADALRTPWTATPQSVNQSRALTALMLQHVRGVSCIACCKPALSVV